MAVDEHRFSRTIAALDVFLIYALPNYFESVQVKVFEAPWLRPNALVRATRRLVAKEIGGARLFISTEGHDRSPLLLLLLVLPLLR